MADPSEGTPFLSDNDHRDHHNEPEDDYVKPLPANFHFKLALRILTAVICFLSLGVGIVLIAAIVFVNTGPFEHPYHTKEEARDLVICVRAFSSTHMLPLKSLLHSNICRTGFHELHPHSPNNLVPSSDYHQHRPSHCHVNCNARLL
jgi:hypothetical protein